MKPRLLLLLLGLVSVSSIYFATADQAVLIQTNNCQIQIMILTYQICWISESEISELCSQLYIYVYLYYIVFFFFF